MGVKTASTEESSLTGARKVKPSQTQPARPQPMAGHRKWNQHAVPKFEVTVHKMQVVFDARAKLVEELPSNRF